MTVFFAFLIGTVWGSFFFTLALRFSDDTTKNAPITSLLTRSHCPFCGTTIPAVLLIPIFGYLIARGRCQKCGSIISPAYPLAEILYGLLAVAVVSREGITLYAAIMFLILSISIAIAIVDVKTLTVPNLLVGAFVLLSLYPVIIRGEYWDNLFGLILCGAFFLIILLIFPGSFGGGDLKLSSAMGFLLGFEFSIVALETALITGSVIGIFYALKTKSGLRIKFPFAPFLAAGLVVAFFFGRDILLLYYRVIY